MTENCFWVLFQVENLQSTHKEWVSTGCKTQEHDYDYWVLLHNWNNVWTGLYPPSPQKKGKKKRQICYLTLRQLDILGFFSSHTGGNFMKSLPQIQHRARLCIQQNSIAVSLYFFMSYNSVALHLWLVQAGSDHVWYFWLHLTLISWYPFNWQWKIP